MEFQTTAFWVKLTFQAPSPIDINGGVGSIEVNVRYHEKKQPKLFENSEKRQLVSLEEVFS
jgi:hypothetical protein